MECANVAGGLVGRVRGLEMERRKDVVRGCIERRAGGGEGEGEGRGVGELRRWWMGERGRGGKRRRREEPARAKVLGLRRFWEGVGRGEGVRFV